MIWMRAYGFFLILMGLSYPLLFSEVDYVAYAIFSLSALCLLISAALRHRESWGKTCPSMYLAASIVSFPAFLLRLLSIIDRYTNAFSEHFFYVYFIALYFLLTILFPAILSVAARYSTKRMRPVVSFLRLLVILASIARLLSLVSVNVAYAFSLAAIVHGIALNIRRGFRTMDVLRSFIIERGGQGEFSFDDLKKHASCLFDRELTDEDIMRLLMTFERPGIRIHVDVSKRRFRIEVENPDDLLLQILKEHRGMTLREAIEEFKRVFGSVDEGRLLRILRIFGNEIYLEKEGKRVPIGTITELKRRMDGKIVFRRLLKRNIIATRATIRANTPMRTVVLNFPEASSEPLDPDSSAMETVNVQESEFPAGSITSILIVCSPSLSSRENV